jgi:type I restriction enzyme S subunit
LSEIKAIPVPLPPLDEQFQLIEEVERRLSIVDASETTINTNLERADGLRQAILRKAFAGELVPQDPTDEPASALLQRIRTERPSSTRKPAMSVSRSKPGQQALW